MTKVQVVYASRHGGSAGIAERIVEVLHHRGLEAEIFDAKRQPPAGGFDGYVIGSGVYIGHWLDEGIEFLTRNRAVLSRAPVWLFSSGPVAPVPSAVGAQAALETALGPAEGPGSGGHKRIAELATLIGARDHRVFAGAFDPNDPPKSFSERLVRLMPASKEALPAGDFRDWVAIENWAHEIASELLAVAVAAR